MRSCSDYPYIHSIYVCALIYMPLFSFPYLLPSSLLLDFLGPFLSTPINFHNNWTVVSFYTSNISPMSMGSRDFHRMAAIFTIRSNLLHLQHCMIQQKNVCHLIKGQLRGGGERERVKEKNIKD